MPTIVDGSNLCGAARDRRLGLPTDEAEMIRRLQAFRSADSLALTVVFDGKPSEKRGLGGAGGFGGVDVVYSGSGRSADETIIEMVREMMEEGGRRSGSREIVLVSSDRALGASVRALGARVIGCRLFAEMLRGTDSPCGHGHSQEPITGSRSSRPAPRSRTSRV